MSALDNIARMAGLPEGIVPTEAVIVLAWMDEGGEACIGHATLGDPLLTNAIGLLAWAQIQMANGDTE